MYHKITLPNGLRVVSSHYPHTRSVSVAIFLAAGPRYEKPEQAGISHFIEHMCFKGTERWPTSMLVSEAVEGVGGILNGGTDKEATVYWCKVAYDRLPLALDVLSELVRRPKMDPQDVERERPIIIEEINMCWDSPQHRVDQIGDELLWPGQPLGREIAGTKETVGSIDHSMIMDYTGRRYRPNNAVVAVAGNVLPEEVERLVSERLADWEPKEAPTGFPAFDARGTPHIRIEHRTTEQVNLCLGIKGVSAVHPDRFRFDLLNAVLGEGMSSRLFARIREEEGLAYDIHSSTSHFTETGSLNVYAGVEPKRLNEALAAIMEELAALKTDITEAEVTKAREMSKGRLLLRMEDTRSVVSWLGSQELITNRILTPDDVVALVDKIGAEDLMRVARDVFLKDSVYLAVVGPLKENAVPAEALKL